MFYFTRNFERQKLRLQKGKKIYNADANADVNADADADISKWPIISQRKLLTMLRRLLCEIQANQ